MFHKGMRSDGAGVCWDGFGEIRTAREISAVVAKHARIGFPALAPRWRGWGEIAEMAHRLVAIRLARKGGKLGLGSNLVECAMVTLGLSAEGPRKYCIADVPYYAIICAICKRKVLRKI
jgi:hypothetical protein